VGVVAHQASLLKRSNQIAASMHLCSCAKSYDVGPGGGGGAGWEGILGAGATGLNAFMNPNICYSVGFSERCAHALHPGGGPANVGLPRLVRYKKKTTSARRINHSHIYILPRMPFAHSVHANPL
jgi:hypothetical protein